MTCKTISSGSIGNSYILESSSGEVLLLELGVRFNDIKQALKFDLSKVVLALVSHEHLDHAKASKDAIKAGIDVAMSAGTQDKLNIKSHRIRTIKHGQKIKAGEFEIMGFDVHHDCSEPLGFLIRHHEAGVICFITDSFYVDHVFPDVTHFMVEANYSDEIINDRLLCGTIHGALVNRTRASHMSIETCKQLLLANNLSKVATITLLHLSESNSNAKQFKEIIQAATNCNVEVATKGLVRELALYPF